MSARKKACMYSLRGLKSGISGKPRGLVSISGPFAELDSGAVRGIDCVHPPKMAGVIKKEA